MVIVRDAVTDDAEGMSIILAEILSSWESKRPSSPDHVIENYIQHPDRLKCSVAVDQKDSIIGFQSLKIASEGNSYDLPVGWGIIGTYVSLNTGRRGIGKALFSVSLVAAETAGLLRIDATIGDTNDLGLGYYEAMGFRTYRTKPGAICKQLTLSASEN